MARTTKISSGVLDPESSATLVNERLARVRATLPSFQNTDSETSEPSRILNQAPASEPISENGVTSLKVDTQPAKQNRLLDIPLELLYPSDANPRLAADPRQITDLALSLVKEGQLQPLLVVPHPTLEAAYMIIEGHTRKQAAQLIGKPVLSCLLQELPTTRKERYLAGRTSNTARSGLTDMDDGLVWAKLIADGVFSSVAQINLELGLGFSEAQLSRFKAFGDLPESCIEQMSQDKTKFPAAVAAALRQVVGKYGEAKALRLIHDILYEGLTQAQLLERVKRLAKTENRAAPQRKRKEYSPVFSADGQTVLARVTQNSPSLFTVSIPSTAKLDPTFGTKLIAALQETLHETKADPEVKQ